MSAVRWRMMISSLELRELEGIAADEDIGKQETRYGGRPRQRDKIKDR